MSFSSPATSPPHTVVSHSDTTATGAETETLTNGSNSDSLHAHSNHGVTHNAAHTVASHSDTTATGAETETLTDGSDADALHDHGNHGVTHNAAHTVASHSDTTATGAETETLTNGGNASALHVHTVVSLDTTGTGAELTELTDASETTLHSHAAAASSGWTRVGGSTTEATTASTSAVSLVTVGSLNIPAATPIFITFNYRKTAGAGLSAAAGLQLNSTVIFEANAGAANFHSSTSRAEDGFCWMYIAPTVTNYTSGFAFASLGRATSGGAYVAGSNFPVGLGETAAARPTAAITSVVIRGEAGHAALTFGVDEVHIYTWGVA